LAALEGSEGEGGGRCCRSLDRMRSALAAQLGRQARSVGSERLAEQGREAGDFARMATGRDEMAHWLAR